MRYLPIHLDTEGKTIIVVGGGEAAEAKLRTLIKTDANLVVIAKVLSPEIKKWYNASKINWLSKKFEVNDLTSALLVYAATDDAQENSRIATIARTQNVFVNAADQKPDCDFFTPALVDRAPVVVSIGTEGTAPGLARAIKADLEGKLPSMTGALAQKIQQLRGKVSNFIPQLSGRQKFWADILSGKSLEGQLNLTPKEIEQRVDEKLRVPETGKQGHVSLVGSGPGSAELLTLGARQKLHSADVIVYDRLVSQDVLDFGRREAEYIYVGKEPGGISTPQNEINTILVDKAQKGLFVVRLKSGDPLIFGRADEEIDALEAKNISFDIVPGITSAAAAAAEIGTSLTTRGHNKSVAFLTGHDAKGFAEHDWKGLASKGGRAAVYMGVGASRFIQGRLMLHGADPDLAVSVVENASRETQIVLSTTLGQLAQNIELKRIKGPAILLLGYAARKGVTERSVPANAMVGAAI